MVTAGVVDLVELTVPAGGRTLVVGSLRLEQAETPTAGLATNELVRALDEWNGPGVVVLAGDTFDLLGMEDPSTERILAVHARLRRALESFACDAEHHLVVLVGARDHRLAWDERAAASLCKSTGATLALALAVDFETGEGCRRVRFESGYRFDPLWAFVSPPNEHDVPVGVHLVTDVLPELEDSERPWLEDAPRLEDLAELPSMVASRQTYRRASRQLRWLALPLATAVALRLPLVYSHAGRLESGLPILGILADLAIVAVGLLIASRRLVSTAQDVALVRASGTGNERPRNEARALIAAGESGLVTGHTNRAELTALGDGFYANAGSCTDVVVARRARFGLPPVFTSERHLGFIELEAGAQLHVRLLHGEAVTPQPPFLERVVASPVERPQGRVPVVAAHPQGGSWPPTRSPISDLRRPRRWAAALTSIVGIVNLVSAVTPPRGERLSAVLDFMPLGVAEAATALVALAGLGLLILAGGIRRGQRLAWQLALGLLTVSVLLHVAKGIDVEEAVVGFGAAGFLLAKRGAFRARVQPASIRRGILTVLLGASIATATATAAIELIHRRPRPPLGEALLAAVERLIGLTTVAIPGRTGRFLTPSLAAVGFGLLVAAGWLALRPAVIHRARSGSDLQRARGIVRRYGGDTLAYFALRDDKQFFFHGESVVAYAVFGAICLVAPDPVGPATERDAVWTAFRDFADSQGLHIAVLGAGESWLPVYRSNDMHDLYVGDEAIVDCRRFSLEGGRAKGLRQAVNRVARNGYTVTFHDPAEIDPALRTSLEGLMSESRRGGVERGFAMTLGRVFQRDDRGLLLAVARDTDGKPAAFCHYVPAPDIDGYSLDLMRRTADEEAPNGLTDFVVVETIRYLESRGYRGLALNFAAMRAVLAGEEASGVTHRVERWLLQRMGDSMQIESLWYFNAKYDPEWRPRYAVYDSVETFAAAALAVVRAESFWELPLIGRFLRTSAR
jgi:lysylphosphatidylglycerol synthetase-like protein (DUF2156 family)